MDELVDWAEANKLQHGSYCNRGGFDAPASGRQNLKASAVMGGMLGIKPMIHMNNEGKLINIGKVRGPRPRWQPL